MSPSPMPVISALYGGLYAILLLVLAVRISRMRRGFKIGIGDGGNALLGRSIRAHGNAVEWGLPIVVLLLVAELNRASPLMLHLCGVVFIVARIAHGVGLSGSGGYSSGRFGGTVGTWAVLIVLALWNIYAFARLLLV